MARARPGCRARGRRNRRAARSWRTRARRRAPSAAAPAREPGRSRSRRRARRRGERHLRAHRLEVVAERDGERRRRPRSRGSTRSSRVGASRPEWASQRHGRPTPRPCCRRSRSAAQVRDSVCQPAASIRLLQHDAAREAERHADAASRSRCAAWRSSSAGIAQAGATMPGSHGARASRPRAPAAGSGRGPVAAATAARRARPARAPSDSRQPEQRPSTAAAPASTVPHCGQRAWQRSIIALPRAVPQRLEHPADLGVDLARVGHACAPPPRAAPRRSAGAGGGRPPAAVDSREPELAAPAPRSRCAPSPVEERLEPLEAAARARGRLLLRAAGSTQRASSAAVHWRSKMASGVSRSDRLEPQPLLRARGVEREVARAAAALLRALAVPLVGEEVRDRGAQERAEAARLRAEVVEVALLEEAREVGLRQVLGVGGRQARGGG